MVLKAELLDHCFTLTIQKFSHFLHNMPCPTKYVFSMECLEVGYGSLKDFVTVKGNVVVQCGRHRKRSDKAASLASGSNATIGTTTNTSGTVLY